MALILPEIKHEYIFKEDTQEQKEATFEQCLDDGKEAAYASIGTDPLDSTYVAAPDILPDHEMEYTSTDQHDYLKTIELVWGYTIGIITTSVVLNADTGDILAEGNDVDSYTAPEGVNIKKGRWIRLSGNRNLHPSILRAVEMPEDIICLKDLCAAIQIDEKTGFTIEGFDSSHVINFDNAFQKAWINSEVTFDMSSCKTCKYMFNEGLIKDNSGELLTIQNMQPGTNCDYMFYNSYLYRIPEGIRQAGVGGVYMFCDAMLGRKGDLDNNTRGYKGVLAQRMFYQTPTSQYIYNNSGNRFTNDYYTGMYNSNVDTTDMIFTSCKSNISCALVGVSGPFPQINFAGVTDMFYLHKQIAGDKVVNTVDLSTIDQPYVKANWLINFDSSYVDEINIVGNPEGTALYCTDVSSEFAESANPYISKTLINCSYENRHNGYMDYASGNLTVNITNTLRLYERNDYWKESEEQGTNPGSPMFLLSHYSYSENNPTIVLKITGNIQTRYLVLNVDINPESNCSVYQSYFSTEEEFKRFVNNYSNAGGNNGFSWGFMFGYKAYDSETPLSNLHLECFNFDNVFYLDSIVSVYYNQKSTNWQDCLFKLDVNKNGKPFLLTRNYNSCSVLNIQNPSTGFIYKEDTEQAGKLPYTVNTDTSNKTQINITNENEINIYYNSGYNEKINMKQDPEATSTVRIPILDCPKANIIALTPIKELILKDCLDINIQIPEESCTKKISSGYYFNTFYDDQSSLAVNSFRNLNTNQYIYYFGIPSTTVNMSIHKDNLPTTSATSCYFCPGCIWYNYNTFNNEDLVDLPNFNINTKEDYLFLLASQNRLRVKNYPLSMLAHTCYDGGPRSGSSSHFLPVCYPFNNGYYTLKHDVDSVDIVLRKYGLADLRNYNIYPSMFIEEDLSSISVGRGSWANDSAYLNSYSLQDKGIYIPGVIYDTGFHTDFQKSSCKVLNNKLTFNHRYTSTTDSRNISLSNTDSDNKFPNLETIEFSDQLYNWSLEYNPANNHVESTLKNIIINVARNDSSSNKLGNIDLRWSQALTTESLKTLVDARYASNKTVTINTIPYKLLTQEQIQTLSAKVTLTEYIPQEGEV